MNTLTLARNAAARNLFDEFFGDMNATAAPSSFSPSVDVAEAESAYLLRMDLPGVSRENVKLEMKDDTLTISGNRKAPEEAKGYRYCETGYGSFSRSFSLPQTIDREHIEAKMADGVLEVKLSLKPEVGPRKIEIA